MKNEDKIVELLSEYLKKHDALEERFVNFADQTNQTLQVHSDLLKNQSALLELLVKGQDMLVKGQEQLVKGQEETNQTITRLANAMSGFVELHTLNYSNHEQRIRELERKVK